MDRKLAVRLQSDNLSPEQLKALLAVELLNEPDLYLEIERFRAVEAVVLVAIVGAMGTGLGALITGILKVAADARSGKIVLHGRSGRVIEVPSQTPSEKIREYIQLAKELEIDQIEL